MLTQISDIGISPVNKIREEFGTRYSNQNEGNLQFTSRESNRNFGNKGDYNDRLANSAAKMINNDLSGNKMPSSAETRANEGDTAIKQSGIRGVFMREHITQNEIFKQNDQKKLMREVWESQINEKKRKKEEEKLKDIELNKREEERMKKEFEQQLTIEQNQNDMQRTRLNRVTSKQNFANVNGNGNGNGNAGGLMNKEKEQQIKETKDHLGTLVFNKNNEDSNELMQTGNRKAAMTAMTIATDQDEQIMFQGEQIYFRF